MNFVTGLLIYTNWKGKTYNLILVIINWFKKNDILQASQGDYPCLGLS